LNIEEKTVKYNEVTWYGRFNSDFFYHLAKQV